MGFRPAIRIAVKDWDGRHRNVNTSQLNEILQDDFDRLFKRIGNMTLIYDKLWKDNIIQNAVDEVFNDGAEYFEPIGYWARKYREAIGTDPDSPPLTSTGRLKDSLRRISSNRGSHPGKGVKSKEVAVMRIAFSAPYAQSILEDHIWEVPVKEIEERTGVPVIGLEDIMNEEGVKASDYYKIDLDSDDYLDVPVEGKNYPDIVFDEISFHIMSRILDMKTKEINSILDSRKYDEIDMPF